MQLYRLKKTNSKTTPPKKPTRIYRERKNHEIVLESPETTKDINQE